MTLTDRDRKVLIFLVPVLVIFGYWFLLLSPQRQEASRAAEEVARQQDRRDTAQQQLNATKGAEQDFSADYTQVVRLGKAIPASVDMPSLIVQLDAAAAGTGITFTKIKTGERLDSAATAPTGTSAVPPGTTPPVDPATPAAAGGEQTQSAPGGAVEAANDTAQTANEQAGATDTTTAAAPPGLETVPLELEFTGNFFNLADFFHRVKRFVEVAESDVVVSGRLLTIEGVRWTSDPELFPKIRAEIKATIYLSPQAQGATAGASPSGPAPTTTTPAGAAPPAGTAPTRNSAGGDGHPMKNLIDNVWADLREKRLWPVAALLLAALVAVPLVLKKAPEEPPPAQPVAATPRPAPESKELKGLASVKLEETLAQNGSSLDAFVPEDPFRPPQRVVDEAQDELDGGVAVDDEVTLSEEVVEGGTGLGSGDTGSGETGSGGGDTGGDTGGETGRGRRPHHRDHRVHLCARRDVQEQRAHAQDQGHGAARHAAERRLPAAAVPGGVFRGGQRGVPGRLEARDGRRGPL